MELDDGGFQSEPEIILIHDNGNGIEEVEEIQEEAEENDQNLENKPDCDNENGSESEEVRGKCVVIYCEMTNIYVYNLLILTL
jgi:hypothetical protein